MSSIFDDRGIRFEYPPDWDVEVTDDGPRTTVALQAPDGIAFAFVTLDEDQPDPESLADEALAAMRNEYPGLDAMPATETIDGHEAIGHDLEFFSLDVANACSIRCLRTPRRTVLVFGQWSDLDEDQAEPAVHTLKRTFEETDG